MNSGSFVRRFITHSDAYWLPFIFNVLLPPSPKCFMWSKYKNKQETFFFSYEDALELLKSWQDKPGVVRSDSQLSLPWAGTRTSKVLSNWNYSAILRNIFEVSKVLQAEPLILFLTCGAYLVMRKYFAH